MLSSHLFRRVLHTTAAIYLVYYLLPDELWPGFYKWQGVVLLVLLTLIIEIIRLKKGKVIFGLRKYEKNRISAFAWFALGIGIAVLFFKMEFVVPVVIGMALIDPLIGEIRRLKAELYPYFPTICYSLIMLICLLLLTSHNLLLIIIFTMVGTLTAIASESLDIRGIDDDFLMIILPLLVMTALYYAFVVLGIAV